jgi:catechol 2,3-dioxygenase-like lactoylglutathione lyase family enzyme
MSKLNLRFLYIYCNDMEAMRRFYSDLLQLTEIYYDPGPHGGLAYNCDELQFTIFPAQIALPVPTEWHRQPGWQGGTLPGKSWSVVSESRDAFAATVTRLLEAQVPAFFDKPRWLGYWSFPVKDPMGNTVELTLPTDSEPLEKVWQ